MNTGLRKLMEDLNLKSFDELYDFLNDPENKNNPIVQEYQEFIAYASEVMKHEE
jgi:hypothetical protein